MKRNNIKLGLLIPVIMLFSCSDDEFLVEEPQTFYTADNIFTSTEQVQQVLITLYSDLRDFRLTNALIKGHGTDILDAPQFRIGNTFNDYSRITPETPEFYDIYAFYYRLIATANTALYAANLETMEWESESEKAYAIAQARFFRGYAHGRLAELFGGVPIVTELADEPRFDYVRASREEVYLFAISELEAALPDLPEVTNQPGRLVKGAAQHYLAEFYLALGIETSNDEYFAKSIEYASALIEGGMYSLMTERFGSRAEEPGKSAYWDLFQMNNINYADGNKESIWTFQIDFDAYLQEDGESLLNYPRYYMPVLRAIPGIVGTAEDVGGRGVAFHAPTPYIKNYIWEGELESNDIRNAEHNITRTFYYNDPSHPEFGEPVPQSVIEEYNESGWIFPIFQKLTTDQFVGLDQGEDRSNLFRDAYAIRLAETILLRAEAYYRLGNLQEAAEDINMLRRRSGAAPIVASDVDIDFILDERARELFIEENRWATLLRMGGTVAVDRIREYALHQDLVQATLNFDFNLWPIPQDVIDRNKDVKLEQNPAWQ